MVINCSGSHGGQRYADIRYLFKQKSQKKSLLTTNTNNLRIVGFFESYYRKKTYILGTDKDRMEKHFPLHHLLTRHNIQGLKKFKDVEAINFQNFRETY